MKKLIAVVLCAGLLCAVAFACGRVEPEPVTTAPTTEATTTQAPTSTEAPFVPTSGEGDGVKWRTLDLETDRALKEFLEIYEERQQTNWRNSYGIGRLDETHSIDREYEDDCLAGIWVLNHATQQKISLELSETPTDLLQASGTTIYMRDSGVQDVYAGQLHLYAYDWTKAQPGEPLQGRDLLADIEPVHTEGARTFLLTADERYYLAADFNNLYLFNLRAKTVLRLRKDELGIAMEPDTFGNYTSYLYSLANDYGQLYWYDQSFAVELTLP